MTQYIETFQDGTVIERPWNQDELAQHAKDKADNAAAQKAAADQMAANTEATSAAVAHAKSLGFTDAMIAVMYPNLVTGAEPLVVGRESLNIPAKIDNNVTLDTVNP
jgi:hypothetical protein